MREAWGVDLGCAFLRAVHLIDDGAMPRAVAVQQVPLPPDASGAVPYRAAIDAIGRLKRLCHLERGPFVLGIPGHLVSARYLGVPVDAVDAGGAGLGDEIQRSFPLRLEEALWDWCTMCERGTPYAGEQRVAVFALPRELCETLLTPWGACGLWPTAVVPSTLALANILAHATEDLLECAAMVAVEALTSELVTIHGARLWSHAFRNDWAHPPEDAWCSDITGELHRLLGFRAALEGRALQGLFLVGGAGRTPGLAEHMGRELECPPRPLPGDLAAAVGADHALAAGLALQGLGRGRWSVDLRPQDDPAHGSGPAAARPWPIEAASRAPTRASGRSPSAGTAQAAEDRYGLVLSRITSLEKRGRAARLLVDLRGMSWEEAWLASGRTIVPVLKDVALEEAEKALARFEAAGIRGRVTRRRGPT